VLRGTVRNKDEEEKTIVNSEHRMRTNRLERFLLFMSSSRVCHDF